MKKTMKTIVLLAVGGLALAVRSRSGRAPDTFIADRRRRGSERLADLKSFLGAELDSRLRLPHYSDADIAAIRALLTESGAADTVRKSIAALSACARTALLPLPDNPWRGMLDTLVEQMLIRSV